MEKYYSPKGMLLWDSWFIKKNDKYHAFYLQALPSKNHENRHNNKVSIGHAISTDLFNWKEFPTVLTPGNKNDWDSLALWTGSIIEKDGKYFMFYTGRRDKPNEKQIQRIGLATSNDLFNWKKYENNPIIEADNCIYDMNNNKNAIGKMSIWRDPYVFQDPKTNKYYMIIAARKKGVETEYNGCIAIAQSDNLFDWKLLPPLLEPNIYDEMEVPQMIIHKGIYYLFFSTHASNYKPDYAKKMGSFGGKHCYYSSELFGTYKPINTNGIVYNYENKIYGLNIIASQGNVFKALGWLNEDIHGKFVGKLSHPIEMEINDDKIIIK
ncbi:MAG: glycoside hydrolase family 68 protein [bacterium]